MKSGDVLVFVCVLVFLFASSRFVHTVFLIFCALLFCAFYITFVIFSQNMRIACIIDYLSFYIPVLPTACCCRVVLLVHICTHLYCTALL